ncbi:MAG: thioredoxin family protein [Rikenellaceae bacterium]
MKNLTLLLFTFFTSVLSYAQSDYNSVLTKAKSQNKLVLLDFYTDWCVPCKQMDEHIFTQQRVKNVIDRDFIRLRIDAEKGEGIALAEKYQVSGYPTLLFLNSDGLETHRMQGAPFNTNFFLEVLNVVEGKSVDMATLLLKFRTSTGSEKLKVAQEIALVGPAHFILLRGEAQKVMQGEVKTAVDYYFANKNVTEMINRDDFEIISMFLDGASNEKPQIIFLYKNYEKFKSVVGEEDLAPFVVKTNNQSIQEYSRRGDLIWKRFVGYIGSELASAYAFMGEKNAKELMTCVANINAAVFVDKNFDRYITLRDKYTELLKTSGEDAKGNYLYAAQVLYNYSNGELSVKQVTKGLEWLQKNVSENFNLPATYMLMGDFYAMLPDKKAEAIANYNRCVMEAKKQGERVEAMYLGKAKTKIDKLRVK